MTSSPTPERPQLKAFAWHFVTSRWWYFGAITLVSLPMFIVDWDVFEAVAKTDAGNEGWFIDQLATLALILGIAALARHAALLRWEVRRRQAAEAEATLLARHDPLTGLPNRRLLNEVMTDALSNLQPGRTRTVMLIDLDGFKLVNDAHGHAVGDALLASTVERMARLAEAGTTLARLGGDEFVLLLPENRTKAEAARFADLIVSRLAEPFQIGEREIVIGASVGVAFAPDDGATAPALLRAADVALYRAKAMGRGIYCFFEPEMDRAAREQATLKADLRNALALGQIVPFYQPTVDLVSGAVNGLEALARWHHPSRGLLMPDVFIPLAEDMRLMTRLTVRLFEQACVDAAAWPARFRIAFNVSPSQLRNTELCERLEEVIARTGVDATRFEVEITETALIQDVHSARAVINRLRAMGLTVALDDFGTGYSSLYHLREITFDKVKIDKSFVRGITTNPTASRYVEAIIRLVTSLDLQVTAEGIEEPDVRAKLVSLGCTFGQGFMFSRPVAASEVGATLRHLAEHPPTLTVAGAKPSA